MRIACRPFHQERCHVNDVKEILHVARMVGDFGQRLSACVREIFADARSHPFLCVLNGVIDIHGNGFPRDVVEATCLGNPVVVPGERSDSKRHETESVPLLSGRSLHIDLEPG